MAFNDNRNWWLRNWKWFVPTGCITLIALFSGVIILLITLLSGAMKSSDSYKIAVETAQNNISVQKAIGTPVKEGSIRSGSINSSGESGDADLFIDISGPKGKAVIHAVATKSAGKWTYSTLVVDITGSGEKIDLTQLKEKE